MEYWITNNDMNIWKVIQNGNNMKRTGKDRDGRIIILPSTTVEEHIAEEESKALITVDTLVDWTYHDGESDGVIASNEFGIIAGCDTKGAIKEGAAKIYNLISGADTKEASTAGHSDLDESQMSYGTKSSTSSNSKSMSNDFVSCDDSDKSLEVNTNDFASSNSSVKSSEPKPNDSTSCASTSRVSTSENEAEIESNVRTPIQEPIIVQDLPSLSCNSSDKNENTSRTSCNKNGYFHKKAGHFRKNASFVSKLCFVCGSGTHLIKDCNFYEKQMANKTVVPTGKPKVFALIPAGKQNRPFPVPTDRGYSPSENPFSDAEVEGILDSGCSRSMTSNKERLDDFQVIQGRKVTFRGGEEKITGKGTIRTPTLDFENVYYVKELQQFNLFSISQICDKKNRVLFTDTECLVLSKDFKLPDESMVVLRVYKKHNLYTINLNNLCPRGNLACLVAHASVDESEKWHRRMGHVNYKNMNRLVKVSTGRLSIIPTGRVLSPGRIQIVIPG
nr:ribonuclease H-like domain-containing protein [Tanacetum cinerariifolium]